MVLVFLLAGWGAAWGQRAQLLSFRDLPVPENGYLASFSIDTWTVRVLAVCHLPPGWTITAGMSANFSGVLSGHGSHGATFLSRDQLHRLDNMLLVEVTEYAAKEEVLPGGGKRPASFDGRLDVGV